MIAPEERCHLDGGLRASTESKPRVAQIVETIRRPGDLSPPHEEWRAVKTSLRQGPSRTAAVV